MKKKIKFNSDNDFQNESRINWKPNHKTSVLKSNKSDIEYHLEQWLSILSHIQKRLLRHQFTKTGMYNKKKTEM